MKSNFTNLERDRWINEAVSPEAKDRLAFLDSIEDTNNERCCQGYEALDTEDLSNTKELNDYRRSESLRAHGMHIVTIIN